MRVLSGIQPSGFIHLGNFFGALRQFVELQSEGHTCFFFLADFHAMTTTKDPEVMRTNTIDATINHLAVGLDPNRVNIFRQSDVPEVTELTWYLSTCTPMGLLERCHAYKDKLAAGQSPDHGLFAYPVLMAADILIYEADLVPVGADQKQHLEVTRDIAGYFNRTYGDLLRLPEARILGEGCDVPGVDGRKMSKSYGNYIEPFAPEKRLREQVLGIVTDSTPLEEPKDPDRCNVFSLYRLLAGADQAEEMRRRYLAGGYGYGHAKKALLELILDYFGDARRRREELVGNPDYVQEILRQGAENARDQASRLLARLREAVGFLPRPAGVPRTLAR